MPEAPATSDSVRPADPGDGRLHGGRSGPVREVFGAFLKLGCTAFGGPIAHLGYFQNEFVKRRRWIDEATFADTVALCQFLPGPTSSQVGLALGWRRAGWRGAFAAWFAFTMPSTVLMLAFAYGVRVAGDLSHAGWVQGLKVAAVAVVAQAVWTMAKKLCPDVPRAGIAVGALAALLLMPQPWMQLVVLVGGAAIGTMLIRWLKAQPEGQHRFEPGAALELPGKAFGALHRQLKPCSRLKSCVASASTVFQQPAKRPTAGYALLAIFFVLLFLLPWLARMWPVQWLQVFAGFFQAGSLVFGGGHVVLPLLERTTVARGWLDHDHFLAGYGAAQALPGPLFTFSAYLGALIPPGGIGGGILALIAIYLPTVLLVFGTLPQWDHLRAAPQARALLAGTNAAVVGLLAAAFCHPIWTSTIVDWKRFALMLAAYIGLEFWRIPPWLIVLACALLGGLAS